MVKMKKNNMVKISWSWVYNKLKNYYILHEFNKNSDLLQDQNIVNWRWNWLRSKKKDNKEKRENSKGGKKRRKEINIFKHLYVFAIFMKYWYEKNKFKTKVTLLGFSILHIEE